MEDDGEEDRDGDEAVVVVVLLLVVRGCVDVAVRHDAWAIAIAVGEQVVFKANVTLNIVMNCRRVGKAKFVGAV